MSKAFPGFAAPSAGFDEPFDMLSACHERIEAQLDILNRLLPHLASHGADEEARAAAKRVLRYFDEAGPKHHADEENDLFPLLESQGALANLLPVLRSEHRAMEAAYAALRPALEAVARGTRDEVPATLIADFCSLYRAHMAKENTELLPAAAGIVTDEDRRRLGRIMAARRSIP